MRLPLCSPASILFPSALPSGQLCALSSTLPRRPPGSVPWARSHAKRFLPATVSGGVPGTPCAPRGGVTTPEPDVTPGIEIELGAKACATLPQPERAATGERNVVDELLADEARPVITDAAASKATVDVRPRARR